MNGPANLLPALILFLAFSIGVCTTSEKPDGPVASPEAGWPQWRGPRRDGVSAETGLLAQWPAEGPRLRWKIEGLGRGWSSPIIAGGTLFVTGDTGETMTLHALDLNGQVRWRKPNGAAWTGSWPGARSCPVYAGGTLYHLNAHGRLTSFDATNGKELWSIDILERFGSSNPTWAISESLLVDGPHLFVTPAGPKTLMAALDRKDGRTVWTSEPIPDEQLSYCSPILFSHAERRILSNCTSHHAFGVDADTGKLLWKVPLRGRWGANCSTPVYHNGRIYYVTCDGPNGQQFRLAPDGSGVRAEPVWRSDVDGLTGGGLLVNGRLFVHGCKLRKSLHCVDWESGESRYEVKLNDGRSSHAAAAMVWAEGRLYAFFEDGTMALLVPGEKSFEIAGRFQLVQAKQRDAWTHPVLLDGRLYLRYHDTLWCYDVK